MGFEGAEGECGRGIWVGGEGEVGEVFGDVPVCKITRWSVFSLSDEELKLR